MFKNVLFCRPPTKSSVWSVFLVITPSPAPRECLRSRHEQAVPQSARCAHSRTAQGPAYASGTPAWASTGRFCHPPSPSVQSDSHRSNTPQCGARHLQRPALCTGSPQSGSRRFRNPAADRRAIPSARIQWLAGGLLSWASDWTSRSRFWSLLLRLVRLGGRRRDNLNLLPLHIKRDPVAVPGDLEVTRLPARWIQ